MPLGGFQTRKKMYIVISYNNYRKEVSISVIGFTESIEDGKKWIDNELKNICDGEKIIDANDSDDLMVYVETDVIYNKTYGDGWDKEHYALVKVSPLKPKVLKKYQKLNNDIDSLFNELTQ